MAIRQYIGARYVPKPEGTFDSSKEYEPLTIVDDGNGNSYTSKIPVPAGTSLDDRKYWLPSWNGSGAIVNLQNRVQTLETETAGIQEYVEKETVNEILVIADSYGGITVNGKTAADVLSQFTGRTVYNCYQGGTNFRDGTMLNRLQAFISTIPDVTKISDVLIYGGANDVPIAGHTASEIVTGITNMATYIRANFPNVKNIKLCCCGMTYAFQNGGAPTRKEVVEAWIEGCAINNLVYVKGSENTLKRRAFFVSDAVHPTENSVIRIAKMLVAALNSNVVDVEFSYKADITEAENAPFHITTNKWQFSVKNDTVEISGLTATGLLNLTFDSTDPPPTTVQKIATISDYSYDNTREGSSFFTVEGWLINGSNYYPAAAQVTISSGEIWISVSAGLSNIGGTRFIGRTNKVLLQSY